MQVNRLGVVAWEEFFGAWNVDRLRTRFREHDVRKKIDIQHILCYNVRFVSLFA
jgi:hypothetical protein